MFYDNNHFKPIKNKKHMTTSFIKEQRKKHVNMMEREKRSDLEKYVKEENGQIRVDWKKLLEMKQSRGGDDYPQEWSDVLYYLEIKQVLTPEFKGGSFFLVGCGMDISPVDGSGKYHFTRREDAEEYKKYEYGNAQYSVKIARLE